MEEKTMTIKEVAGVLGVDQSTVRKRAKDLYPWIFKNGKTTYLNEVQTTRVKKELFDKNPNLGRVSEVKTDLEKELLIQQAMTFQAEKITKMQNEINTLKPRALLADEAIRDESRQYSITDAGKHLGIRQSDMFSILRSDNMLTKKNLPTQRALDKGILSVRTNVTENGNRPQSVMTMENIYFFKNKYPFLSTTLSIKETLKPLFKIKKLEDVK